MSGDLAEFLAARLDEDEAAAKAAIEADGADWTLGSTEDDDKRSIRHVTPAWDFYVADRVDQDTAAHIARHDPARVLREVEAKRRILTWYSSLDADYDYGTFPDDTIAALALSYSDHPDSREEWKP